MNDPARMPTVRELGEALHQLKRDLYAGDLLTLERHLDDALKRVGHFAVIQHIDAGAEAEYYRAECLTCGWRAPRAHEPSPAAHVRVRAEALAHRREAMLAG